MVSHVVIPLQILCKKQLFTFHLSFRPIQGQTAIEHLQSTSG